MTEPVTPLSVEPIPVERIGSKAITIAFEADETARAALAERFGLVELTEFRAEARLRRRKDTGWIELKGTLQAAVVQECVVTLEPVVNRVDGEIDELFDDAPGDGREGNERIEVDLDPVADDPEPLEGDVLDVGEIIAQILSLSIDPYPRAPGVPEPEVSDEPAGSGKQEDGTGEASPFAALALLKDRDVKKR